MKVVIIGCGPAGHNAAVTLKKGHADAEVTLIDPQTTPYYSKIRLPQFIAEKIDEATVVMARREDYEGLGIETSFGERVDEVDLEAREVTTDAGKRISFDKLVFATGAAPSKPPIPGVNDDQRIVCLRSLADAKNMIEAMAATRRVLMVGGGTIGLELAMVFRNRDKEVEVVELAPRLLMNLLSADESKDLRKSLDENGIRLALGTSVAAFESTQDGVVASLSNDQRVTVDWVVISAGIKPRVDLAKGAGLTTNRGVVVNNRLETSEANVYAIGDCAEIDGRIAGLWSAATAQGKALAKILLDELDEYEESGHHPMVRIPGISLKRK